MERRLSRQPQYIRLFLFAQTEMRYRVGNVFYLVEFSSLEFHFGTNTVNVVLVIAGIDTFQLHLQPTVLVPTLVAQHNYPTVGINQEKVEISVVIIIANGPVTSIPNRLGQEI